MTDYKQLCAELLRAMDEIEECEAVDWSLVKTQPLKMASQSMAEVRAALSEREPEGPTDIELLSMAGTAIGHEIEFGEYEPETECAVEAYGSELIDFARAVLARWGNNTSRSNFDG